MSQKILLSPPEGIGIWESFQQKILQWPRLMASGLPLIRFYYSIKEQKYKLIFSGLSFYQNLIAIFWPIYFWDAPNNIWIANVFFLWYNRKIQLKTLSGMHTPDRNNGNTWRHASEEAEMTSTKSRAKQWKHFSIQKRNQFHWKIGTTDRERRIPKEAWQHARRHADDSYSFSQGAPKMLRFNIQGKKYISTSHRLRIQVYLDKQLFRCMITIKSPCSYKAATMHMLPFHASIAFEL